MAQKLLVTGGCGFIGSTFVRRWLAGHPDDDVRNLDALTYAAAPGTVAELRRHRHHKLVQGDIADPKKAAAAAKGVDAVVHFAAQSHVDRSIRDPNPFVRTNVLGTQVLLEAARRADVPRFHHVSTDEVFGELPLRPRRRRFDEDSPYRPRSPYAASKAASDHLVRAWGATYGLRFTITNGGNNYGPYQSPEKAVPRFITNLIDGKRVPVYGKGKNVRDWLHVEDYCRAIELVLRKGKNGRTYCVSADEQLDNLGLARRIATAFGRGEDAIEFVKDRQGHDLRYALDASRIRRELGWRPRWTISEGLKATIQWYRDHEAWWRPLKRRAEAIYR